MEADARACEVQVAVNQSLLWRRDAIPPRFDCRIFTAVGID
jgi:hypothetical protein